MKDLINVSGYLYKKGTGLSSSAWKRRWFILNNGIILNYYVDDKLEKKPKGTIYLEIVDSVQIDPTSTAKEFKFQILTKKRVYHLYAETEKDRELWINNLTQCLANFKKLSGIERPRSSTLPSVIVQSERPLVHQSLPTNLTAASVNSSGAASAGGAASASGAASAHQGKKPSVVVQSSSKSKVYSETKLRICGAKMLDSIDNEQGGFITCILAITRKKLWTGDSKGGISVWNINRAGDSDLMSLSYQMKESKDPITGMVYVPDKKIVYTSCKDASGITCWDTRDHHKIFSFPTSVQIEDMIELRNEMLLYCGSNARMSSLFLFDPSSKTESEIPFNKFLPPLANATSSVFRRFVKLGRSGDGRILAATDQSEIVLWNPWEKEACKVMYVGHNMITAMDVIADTLWVCSLQESAGIFSIDTPCVVSLYSMETTRMLRAFETPHPISRFSLVNGLVWAISRESLSIYDPSMRQILYDGLDLPEKSNYSILHSHGYCWVGGSHCTRYKITEQWIDHNLSLEDRSQPDLSIENLDYLLTKIKSRLQFEHQSELYDIVLKIGEQTLAEASFNYFKIKIVKLFFLFGRNKLDYINSKIIFKLDERINRISLLLQRYLAEKDQVLVYEALKTINALCNFDKFCKYIKIENILRVLNENDQPSSGASATPKEAKDSGLGGNYSKNQISFINYALLIINQLIELDPLLVKNNSHFNGDFKSKLYFSILANPSLDSSIHLSILNIFKKLDYEVFAKHLKKSSSKYIPILLGLLKDRDSVLYKEMLIFLQDFCKKKVEFKESIGKNVPDFDANLDDSMLIYHYITPTLKKSLMADPSTHRENQARESMMAHHSTSLINSIIFSMNSLLKTLKSKSLKGAKLNVKEINVPQTMDLSRIFSDSIIKLMVSFPKSDFVVKAYFELAPKDLTIVLEVILGVKSTVTISEISIKGNVTVGFVIGTPRLHWLSFDQDPEINFQMKAVGMSLESVLKPLILKIIRKKFVSPNLYHLSDF